MREDQEFREKRMAETLARAIIEVIRDLSGRAEASATAGADALAAPEVTPPRAAGQIVAREESGVGPKDLEPPPTARPSASGVAYAAFDPAVTDSVTQLRELGVPVVSMAGQPMFPADYKPQRPPTPDLPPLDPPQVEAQKRDYQPVRAPRLELEPIETTDAWNHISAVDGQGQRRHIMDLDERTRAYDETVGILADQTHDYDRRFRGYRNTEYAMLEQTSKDLAEDYRRLEALHRGFMTCRSTITDANV